MIKYELVIPLAVFEDNQVLSKPPLFLAELHVQLCASSIPSRGSFVAIPHNLWPDMAVFKSFDINRREAFGPHPSLPVSYRLYAGVKCINLSAARQLQSPLIPVTEERAQYYKEIMNA